MYALEATSNAVSHTKHCTTMTQARLGNKGFKLKSLMEVSSQAIYHQQKEKLTTFIDSGAFKD